MVSRIGGNSFPFQQGQLSFFLRGKVSFCVFFQTDFFFKSYFQIYIFKYFFPTFFQTDLLKLILFLLLPIPSLEVRSLENVPVRSQDFVIIIFKKRI